VRDGDVSVLGEIISNILGSYRTGISGVRGR